MTKNKSRMADTEEDGKERNPNPPEKMGVKNDQKR